MAEARRRFSAARSADDAARRRENRAQDALRRAFDRAVQGGLFGRFWAAVERAARAMYWRAHERREQTCAAFWAAVDAGRLRNIRAFRAAWIRRAAYEYYTHA